MHWSWLVVLGGCLISPVIPIGKGKTRSQVQHEQATRVTPGTVKAVDAWSGEVHTMRVRVWADDEYRAQHVKWQATFGELLDDANGILAKQFGVKLLPDYGSWPYRAPGATLEDTLRALATHDPASDVQIVIGLTSSLSLVTTNFDQLGVAMTPGRHLVMRGFSDLHERAAMEAYFTELRTEERDVMFEARRRHKQLAVLLHELGHVFGAAHQGDTSSLMLPTYSVDATSFDAVSRTTVTANLDARLGRTVASGAPPPADARPDQPPPPKPERPPLKLDPADKTPVIVLVVDADGARSVDNKPVADAQLDGIFLLASDKSKRTRIYIRTEPTSPKDVVDDAVARAKRAGLTRITVTGE